MAAIYDPNDPQQYGTPPPAGFTPSAPTPTTTTTAQPGAPAFTPTGATASGGTYQAPSTLNGNAQGLLQWAQQQFGLKPTNPAAIQGIVTILRANGFPQANLANHNGQPSADKIDFGNGQSADIITGSDGANPTWSFQPYDTANPGGANGTGFAVDPSFLAPFTQPTPDPGTLPQFGGFTPFQAPTAADVMADPSFAFRRDQSVQALTNSKAAQGLFNSGGTVNDIANLASNFASQEYGNTWNRDFASWNADNTNKLSAFGAQQGTSDDQFNRAMSAYTNARDTFYANESNPFGKLATVAQLGANTAAVAG